MRAEPEEVLLVYRVQHLDQIALDDLVLRRSDAALRHAEEGAAARPASVCTAASMVAPGSSRDEAGRADRQAADPHRAVFIPRHPVHADRCRSAANRSFILFSLAAVRMRSRAAVTHGDRNAFSETSDSR